MDFFEFIIVDFIYIAFPLMLYLFYLTYRKNIGKEESEMFLDFTLLSSFYLLIKTNVGFNKYQLLLINLVIIIAYIKKKNITAVIMSAIVIFNYFINSKFLIFYFSLEYFIYFLLSIILKNKNNIFVNCFFIIKFLSIFVLDKSDLKENLLYLLISYVILNIIRYLIKKGEEIINYHISYKEIKRESQIRQSLFRITHEIKNPIAVCKGYLDMFDVNNKEHAKKYIPILKNEINRTLILLEDFLSMTGIKVNKELLDINFLIEDIIEEMKPIMKSNNVSFINNLIDDEIYIMADYNRLTQVFVNLIKNSIESMDKEKNIIKINERIDDFVYIEIEDNGMGMDDEVFNKISEPFYTTKKNGTGLGVSLSKEIINLHNGTLTYETKKDVGTKVIIKLPVVKN